MKDFSDVLVVCKKNVAKILIKKLDNKEKLDKLDYLLIRDILDTFVLACSKD